MHANTAPDFEGFSSSPHTMLKQGSFKDPAGRGESVRYTSNGLCISPEMRFIVTFLRHERGMKPFCLFMLIHKDSFAISFRVYQSVSLYCRSWIPS